MRTVRRRRTSAIGRRMIARPREISIASIHGSDAQNPCIRLIAAHNRVYSNACLQTDEDLGCVARKGLQEPSPVPGYLFVVRVGQQTWEYHTDRQGRIKRCPPAKPKTGDRGLGDLAWKN